MHALWYVGSNLARLVAMETLIMRLLHRLFGSRSEKMPKVWGCFLEMPAEWHHRWLELIETLDVTMHSERPDPRHAWSIAGDPSVMGALVTKGDMEIIVADGRTADKNYYVCLSLSPRTSLPLAKEIEKVFLQNGFKPLSGSLKDLDRYISD